MNAPLPHDAVRKKKLRARNLALFFSLLGIVVLVYAVSIVKMSVTGAP